ncbi:114 kDa polyprotein [Cucurbit mild mosaic virus]|uniref:RNA2 polyprotein n=1 Tax=Cucurbit mild mosaic virus TaxID=1131416 RepID=F8J1U4_9SECO|nr:114 kDa polyprotein [Cucurbit mild mosaic virus]ACK76424.1 114 kDa polyprotein [Cucurbit mild mosaic virus]
MVLLLISFIVVVCVILDLEYTYIVKPFVCDCVRKYERERDTPRPLFRQDTYKHYTKENFLKFFFPSASSYRRCTSSFSPTKTYKEMSSMANVTPVHTIPKEDLLKRAENYKLAQESKKSLLPDISKLYETPTGWKAALKKLMRDKPEFVKTSELNVGSIRGTGATRMKVPITPGTFDWQSIDTRLPMEERKKGDQVMVAAVEIVADGFASVSSDVTMAAALYDKRHNKLENSFKGSFATRASGMPSHVVFYPTHRVPVEDDPNDTLELSVVSRDTDFSEEFTLANFTARTVFVKAKGPDKVAETKELLTYRSEDLIKARQFVAEGNFTVAVPRMYPKVNLDNYTMPHGKGVVQSYGTYNAGGIMFTKPKFAEGGSVVLNYTGAKCKKIATSEDSPKPSAPLCNYTSEDDEDPDVKYGQALMEEDIQDAETNMFAVTSATETMRMLVSGSGEIPLNTVTGHRLFTLYMNDLWKQTGPHVQLLNMLAKIPGSIRMKVHCQLSPGCGIGLACSYVEGNESLRLGTDLGRLLGLQHKKWNPAIEPKFEFYFKPFSCCDWWNMHFMGTNKFAPVLTILALSGWNGAPKVSASFTYALFYEPDIVLPKQIATLSFVPNHMIRKELGTLTFAQNERKAYGFEVNFGKSQVHGSTVTHTFTSAYCGLAQFLECDVIFELTMMSNPLIGATFTLAYVAGTYLKHIKKIEMLDALPHVTFTFERSFSSTKQVRFPKTIFPTYQALDRWDLSLDGNEEVSGHFVLYQRDKVSSLNDGDLVVRLAVRAGSDVLMHGVSTGYPTTSSRDGKGKTGARNVLEAPRKAAGIKMGQSLIDLPDFQNVFYPVASWFYDKGKHPGIRNELDISTHILKMRLDGTKNNEGFEVKHSAVTRLLQNCAWIKGTLHWKVVVKGSSEHMSYRRTSQIEISVHENSLSSNEFFKSSSSLPSCCFEFSRKVIGPVDGFRAMGWNLQGDKKFYKLCVTLGNVHECESVNVYCRLGEDVQIAGQQKGGFYELSKPAKLFKEIDY